MKKVIRPFELGSTLLFIIGMAFPLMTVYLLISMLYKGINTISLIYIAIGVALTYFISINALKIFFMSKITFYDTYLEAVYFDPFAQHFKGQFYKIISPQKVVIKYSDIEKFGSFEGSKIRKDGRDENNRLRILVNAGGIPIPFIIPKSFDTTRNYFIINGKDSDNYIIDGKLYSVAQVKQVLNLLKKSTGKNPVGGYPDAPNMMALTLIIGLISIVAFPYGLNELEYVLNQSHNSSDNLTTRTLYFVSGIFFMISLLANVLLSKMSKSEEDFETIKKYKTLLYIVSAILFVVTAVLFIVTVIQ